MSFMRNMVSPYPRPEYRAQPTARKAHEDAGIVSVVSQIDGSLVKLYEGQTAA